MVKLPEVTRDLLTRAVTQDQLCGAALGVIDRSGETARFFIGEAQQRPAAIPLQEDYYWDLASVTKSFFTARWVLRALEEGRLDLEDKLGPFLPELDWMMDTPLRDRTLRQLLTHTSGLPAWKPLYTWGDPQMVRARLLREPFEMKAPGEMVYSDLGYLMLGRVLEAVYDRRLQDFPLDEGLTFQPPQEKSVSTEFCQWRGRVLRGEVHDENAASLDGAAGHAGLFGTLDGALNQVNLMLRGGWLSPAGMELAVRPHVEGRTTIFMLQQPGASCGSLASPQAYGHTGFTGTCFWVDPARGLGWTLLTNRVHTSRHASIDIQSLRRAVGNTLWANLG